MESNKRKRAASSELPTHARITYHAGPRAFERLFKERSLQELKDVVRRKLGLGSEATVKLKQMRSNALLDLDDDDDFEALRAQALRDAGSTIDIGVTVEEDQSKVPATSTAVTDGPQESIPVTSRGAGSVTKKRKMAFGDDATATTPQAVAHRTERGGEPGGEPKSKARGKKVKPPPKDTHSAAESTQGLPAQPETEADSVTATTKPNVEGEHAGEPPKKRQKRAKEKVVHPSNEPATPGAGLATGERLESIEVLKDSEASKSGRISPPTDNIRERARMAERPIDESPTEAVPPASIKKLAQPRKSKSQASRKVVLSISDRASRQKLTGSDSL
ncbi:hypothetical protein PISMIDRAFT_219217 [Pisolithus microcarpus 441]|uniref:Uncharacterized protein n=1 Tax=Pisolithus microcarpus 441 TaxID=765257 RepID=A0A0D0A4W6_9AGAM|nr:hypothetical protein PISMIDRAFT_219217 [Pisolithus microcarpus 441]